MDNTSGPLNRRGISDLPLLRTPLSIFQKSQEPGFWGSDRLFFVRICKSDSFKNRFAMITRLSELYFRFKKIILWVQKKNVISMGYSSSTSSWKSWRWMRLDLIFTIWDMNSLTMHKQQEKHQFKDIIPWKISQIITKNIPNGMRIAISFWVWWKVNASQDNKMIRIS